MTSWLGHGVSRLFGLTLWVLPWGSFLMRLTLKSIHQVKQIALSNVGGPHSISGRLNRRVRLTFPQRRTSSSCLPLNWHFSSPGVESASLRTGSKPSALCSQDFDSDWNGTVSSLGLQLADSSCRPWDQSASIILWANSYHKSLSSYTCRYTDIHPIDSDSVERPDWYRCYGFLNSFITLK